MRIPEKAPHWTELIAGDAAASTKALFDAMQNQDIQDLTRKANDLYLHWDKFRFQQMPEGVEAKTAWAATQLSRQGQLVPLPLTFQKTRLLYWLPPQQHEWLSIIDQKAGGYLVTRDRRAIPDDNDRYLYNSLMEEAIASSILEGAVTTRVVAKEMLRTQRKPRDKAEQMIVNNYKAILEIRDLKDDKLTPAMLLHLQEILTEHTMDDPSHSGRFRTPSDDIHVVSATDEIIFTPPPADTVDQRIKELCEFANTKAKPFVHPVLKAIALHFTLGFIHPFCDGNGRTARAIFYWYMLKNGYWMFEYLPISRIINTSRIKYAKAYLYTETDGGDLTYFNQYHLRVVVQAINDLHAYLESQQREMNEAQSLVEKFPDLNLRQRMVVSNSLTHPAHKYTVKEHEGKFQITYNTARADLCGLEDAGLLKRAKGSFGKEAVFVAPDDLAKLLGRPRPSRRTKKKKRSSNEAQGNLFDPRLFE